MRRAATSYGRVPATTRGWMVSSGNLSSLNSSDPATTAHFFNTAASFCTGGTPSANPVPGGLAATGILAYASYAQFSSDVSGGAITHPFTWVMYDNENSAPTPTAEKKDPPTYMDLFGSLAHAHGYKVVHAPARDLASVSGTSYPKNPGETDNQWYLRVIAPAAATADILLLQNESYAGTATYASLFYALVSAVGAVNPNALLYSEVSTDNGSASQMYSDAITVGPDGYYVAMPGAVATGLSFLQKMQAAGY